MDLETLLRRYARLKQELSAAYRMRPWPSRHIDRLADDLVNMERQLAQLQPAVTFQSRATGNIEALRSP